MKVLLKRRNALLSTKIWKYLFSKTFQGVRNLENIHFQTVWKIFFVKFQGVGSVICKIFSLKLQELTTFYDLESKFWVFLLFLGQIRSFSNFQYCQHSKTWNFKENKRKSWWKSYWNGGTPFFLLKFGNICFLKLFRGSEI